MKAYGMRQRDSAGETCPCCKNSKGWGKGNRPARKRAHQSANKQVTESLTISHTGYCSEDNFDK